MDGARPLVSIITPSFNQGPFIAQTLASVRAQTYANIEHIVVDGGSTDETLDVLRRFEETYSLSWLSEPDSGMYDAINKGMRLARGDILAYLNTDDRYFPWTVQCAVDAFASHPEAGFLFGDMLNVVEGEPRGSVVFYPPMNAAYLKRTGFLGQPTVFWRRDALEACGGFDDTLKLVADCEYWMRLSDRYEAVKLNEVLAIERDHPGAKRMSQGSRLDEELRLVRLRHAPRSVLPERLALLQDRAYAAAWRRIYLTRFLAASVLPFDGPWRHFLREGPGTDISYVNGFRMYVPLYGRKYSRLLAANHGETAPGRTALIRELEGEATLAMADDDGDSRAEVA